MKLRTSHRKPVTTAPASARKKPPIKKNAGKKYPIESTHGKTFGMRGKTWGEQNLVDFRFNAERITPP